MSSPAANRHDSMTFRGENEKVLRALYGLLELSKSLNSAIDLDTLLQMIVEKTSTVVDAERTSIYMYDPVGERLSSRVAQGLETVTIELPVGVGVAGDVARTLTPDNIPDAYVDSRFSPEWDQRTGFRTRSILCAPILGSRGDLLGVIQSVNKISAPHFDQQDEALMLALASHTAAAIERARLTDLRLENQRLEDALRIASEIQMRMLPSSTPNVGERTDFDVHASIRPARRVGGDLYDYFWKNDRLYFCIGDVSGKGIGAALVMALTKTLFRAGAPFHEDPAHLLAAMNVRLSEDTGPTMFATAFCGYLDPRDGKLFYSNAGHDRPLILSKGTAVRPLESKSGLALGVLPDYVYQSQQATLEIGEAIFLYTDGVSEATNRSEELFTLARLRQTLESCGTTESSAVVQAVIESVDRFAGDAPQADDIAMMCIQRREGKSAGTQERLMEVSGRFRRDIGALDDVFHLVDSFFSGVPIDSKFRYPIDLALEEIFTNFVKYNPRGESDIGVRLAIDRNELMVAITDFDSERFDITVDAPEVDIDEPLRERTPGGLGVQLVKKIMDRVEYMHDKGVGTVTLYKRLE